METPEPIRLPVAAPGPQAEPPSIWEILRQWKQFADLDLTARAARPLRRLTPEKAEGPEVIWLWLSLGLSGRLARLSFVALQVLSQPRVVRVHEGNRFPKPRDR
jgi:hypothetical protein